MEEKTLREAVVVFLVKDGQVLLALKKDRIGKGCLNGYGGGVDEKDSNPETCAIRELEEECGVSASAFSLEKVAIGEMHNTKTDGTVSVCILHVFLLGAWTGEPKESDEMGPPKWFDINVLPIEQMMPADRQWVPNILSGKKLRFKALYGPFQKELLVPLEMEEVGGL